MPRSKKCKVFHPLKVCDDRLLVTGGYNRVPEPSPYRSTMVDGLEKLYFLKMEAREPWLTKGAFGRRQLTPGLTGRTTLFNDLRKKLVQACDGEPTSSHDIRCCGEAPEASSSTDDPMAQVAEDEVVVTLSVTKRIAQAGPVFPQQLQAQGS